MSKFVRQSFIKIKKRGRTVSVDACRVDIFVIVQVNVERDGVDFPVGILVVPMIPRQPRCRRIVDEFHRNFFERDVGISEAEAVRFFDELQRALRPPSVKPSPHELFFFVYR